MMGILRVLTLRFGAASDSPMLNDFSIGRDEEEISLYSTFEKVRQKNARPAGTPRERRTVNWLVFM
jgi:hypothetical protein